MNSPETVITYPGGAGTARLRLVNGGPADEICDLEIEPAPGWSTTGPATALVPAVGWSDVELRVFASPSLPAGSHDTITVKVHSQADPALTLIARIPVVAGYGSFLPLVSRMPATN